MDNKSRIRIEYDPLTPELIEKARKELRETDEQKEESLAKLRQLLEDDKSIYFGDDEENLIRYLRPTKYYPESALAMMKRVADFKEKHKKVLDNLLPEQEKSVFFDHDIVNVLVDRDQDGRRILIARLGAPWDPSKVSGDQIFRIFYLIHYAAMMEPANQINGVLVVLDFNGMGMRQVGALTPSFCFRLIDFIQDAMPLRLKEVHIVNQPFIFRVVWGIIQPLVQQKLKNRLFFHGSKMASFHKYIDPKCLPEDYGGKLQKIDYSGKEWYPCILGIEDFIIANNTYGHVKEVKEEPEKETR